MADMVHIYCVATSQHSWQPAKSIAAWMERGWEPVTDPPEDEDSAAEADKTAGHSRGKPTAKTTKDK